MIFIFVLDWFSKVRAAKGDFLVWISCRFAGGILNVPACERRFLRCSSAVALRAMADKSVVDVYPRPHHALNSCARRLGLSHTDF
jgi:hypothetical protein